MAKCFYFVHVQYVHSTKIPYDEVGTTTKLTFVALS